ncbi:type 2 lanthipeptide synthetase LanM family protein [Floridanema aerugineum]|uniref:Type 2 lanthipeptide synthetase LanM family protein n=1 Tax=Floridaenema aerugineum BLCC-F46 TaxID=3153654 RepID=A0ABV4X0M3_9CYAN
MNTDQVYISTIDLHSIVAKASTLYERLNAEIFSPSLEVDEQLMRSRLDDWCQTVTKGNFQRFQQYLDWDGLTLETAKQAIAPVYLLQDAPLPNWAKTLSAVLQIIPATLVSETNEKTTAIRRFLSLHIPLPFEEIITPFVIFAQKELAIKAGDSYHKLTDEAHAVCERALLCQLIDIAAQPLQLTFYNWQIAHQSSFARFVTLTQEQESKSFYLQFIQEMLQCKLVAFFLEYAALARLLATATELWVQSQYEFLQQLNADWSKIEATFSNGVSLNQVTNIRPLLSDPHQGRRSVIALQIDSNLRLVYKPKHLGIEQAYNQLLQWLNEQGCPLPLKTLQVVSSHTNGWVEFVEPLPCENTAQLERHYRRAGMLLCLVYLLEATDCHFENLIANGEHLVLIDAETLMQHRPKIELQQGTQSAQQIAFNQVNNSVCRTALLPRWQLNANSDFDLSGLGSHAQQTILYQGLQWSSINTDRMALKLQQIPIPSSSDNVPTVNGQPANLSDWIEVIAEGFEQMYRFMLDKQEALLFQDSPLWAMAKHPVRFVFRPTITYFKILNKLNHPKYLRDGIDRSIELEILKRAASGATKKPKFWSLFQAERQQMEQLDIPFFPISPETDALELSPDNRVEEFFQCPSFQSVIERIKTLGEADLAMQIQFIKATLYLRMIPAQEFIAPEKLASDASIHLQKEHKIILDEKALVAEVISIAQRLRERAIYAPDGSVTWLAPQFSTRQERCEFQPTAFTLYNGKLGIALFLGAVEHIRADGEFRQLCLSALQEFRQTIPRSEQEKHKLPSDLNLGMEVGVGGSIYSLTRISQFLAEDSLLVDAVYLARMVTPKVIASDRQLDILGGSAGAILGLLGLYRIVQDSTILDSAVACGRYLLEQSVITSQGRAWKSLDGRLLTGFSHGAAGIAYALLKLAQVTNDTKFQQAAQEAISYEQSVFLPEVGNWPDLRDFSKFLQATGRSELPPLMSSWCHGATGIGLARLAGLEILETEAIHQDIQVAIQTTQKQLTQRQGIVDQLCCGTMGQIELLLCAAHRLGRPELLANAKVYASQVVWQARQKGYYLEPALHSSVYVPGFFRGEAGIGYTLLRLSYPDQLPSVLLWE